MEFELDLEMFWRIWLGFQRGISVGFPWDIPRDLDGIESSWESWVVPFKSHEKAQYCFNQ